MIEIINRNYSAASENACRLCDDHVSLTKLSSPAALLPARRWALFQSCIVDLNLAQVLRYERFCSCCYCKEDDAVPWRAILGVPVPVVLEMRDKDQHTHH